MSWLAGLIVALWNAIVGKRDDDHIEQGKSEQKNTDQQATIDSLNRQAEADANAPQSRSDLDKILGKGKL